MIDKTPEMIDKPKKMIDICPGPMTSAELRLFVRLYRGQTDKSGKVIDKVKKMLDISENVTDKSS